MNRVKAHAATGVAVQRRLALMSIVFLVGYRINSDRQHHYAGLEKLYADNRERGRVVLGLPVNDFANLEPGGNKQIASFCRRNDGVAFPMLEKSPVVRPSINPFYKVLAQSTGDRPQWDFHKHLIGRDSREVLSFGCSVESGGPRLTAQIERMLNAEVRP